MKIVLAGGTGQVGHVLKREFADDDVVVIARSEGVRWDGRSVGDWARALEGADALINLAGRTVDCRYTLLESGFAFAFPEWPGAARDLVSRRA